MVGPHLVMVMIYVVAALTWAVVATTVASMESTNTNDAVVIESTTGDNNDRRPILQPRRFRHEASAVRVLYQTGVSI